MRQGAQASGHTKPGFDGANIEGVDHLQAEAPEQLDILNLGLSILVFIFKVRVLQVLKSSSSLKRPAPVWSELYCRPRGPGRQVRCSFSLPSHPRTSRLQSLQTTPQWCGPCRLLDTTPEDQHCQLQWLQGLGGPESPPGGTSDLSLGIVS